MINFSKITDSFFGWFNKKVSAFLLSLQKNSKSPVGRRLFVWKINLALIIQVEPKSIKIAKTVTGIAITNPKTGIRVTPITTSAAAAVNMIEPIVNLEIF